MVLRPPGRGGQNPTQAGEVDLPPARPRKRAPPPPRRARGGAPPGRCSRPPRPRRCRCWSPRWPRSRSGRRRAAGRRSGRAPGRACRARPMSPVTTSRTCPRAGRPRSARRSAVRHRHQGAGHVCGAQLGEQLAGTGRHGHVVPAPGRRRRRAAPRRSPRGSSSRSIRSLDVAARGDQVVADQLQGVLVGSTCPRASRRARTPASIQYGSVSTRVPSMSHRTAAGGPGAAHQSSGS